MLTLLSFSFKDVASQGINLGAAAVLLLFFLFLLYISVYAIVRNRKKKTAEPQQEEKTIKPKMKGYDQCELNEIMGYDFIQTQYIGEKNKEKGEQEKNEDRGEKKSYAESRSNETTEINESVIGVTGTESNIPKDEPEETPAEHKKRLAEQAAMKAQEEHTKAAAKKDVPVEEIPEEEIPEQFIDKPRGDMANAEEVNEEWPENMDSWLETDEEPDPISGDWQEEFATEDQKAEMADAAGLIDENDEEDAEVMNNLAGEPEDRKQMNALLMNSSAFKDMIDPDAFDAAIDDQDGTESHKQFFLEQLRDEYVGQIQSKPSENENSDTQ